VETKKQRQMKIIELHPSDEYTLKVLIHDTEAELYKAGAEKGFDEEEAKELQAFFYSPPTYYKPNSNWQIAILKESPEIHLIEDWFGVGIFAHELQHFLQFWIDTFDLKPIDDDWENVAYLAGDLTKEFWTQIE